MRTPVVPSLAILALSAPTLALWGEDEPQQASPRPPPVHGLDDFTLIDDRLWTAAVSRRPELISTAPAAVEVLTADDLRLSPAVNWADRLRYVAGVDVYQSRHGQYDVGLRGYNGITNQRLILTVDGREFGRSVTGEQYGFWSGYMFMSDIERVELVKGPSAVAYGANAFGGVISFTGRPMSDQPEVHLVSHVGSYGKREVDGTVLAPLQDAHPLLAGFDLRVNAGYTEADPRPGVEGPPVLMEHPRLGNAGGVDLRSNRQRIILGRDLPADLRLELEYSGMQMRDQKLTGLHTAVTAHGQFEQHGAGITLRADWGSLSHWEQKASASWESEYVLYDPSRDFYYNQVGFRDRRSVSEADVYFDLGDHNITLGGNYISWRSTSNIWTRDGYILDPSSWQTIRNETWGVFIQDQWKLSPSWSLTAGLRFDSDNRVGTHWSPRVSLNWVIDERQFARISYSSGYRIPTLIESDIEVYFYEADESLGAETINALEIGYERRFGGGDAGEDSGRLVANLSYSEANHLISLEPFAPFLMEDSWRRWLRVEPYGGSEPNPIFYRTPGPFFQYTNVDNPLRVWGAELSGQWTWQNIFGGALELWGNTTYQHYRHRDAIILWSPGFVDQWTGLGRIFAFYGDLGRDINGPPPWKVNAGVNWDNEEWHFGLAGRYVSGRRMFSVGNTFWVSRNEPAVQDVSAYAALDANVAWRRTFSWGTLWLHGGVMDIFDSAHYEAFERTEFDLLADLAREWSSEVGRSWYAAADWHW